MYSKNNKGPRFSTLRDASFDLFALREFSGDLDLLELIS